MAAGWMFVRLLLRTLCEVDRFERIEPSEAALDRKSTIVTLFFATIRVEVRESNRSAHAPQLSLFVGRTSGGRKFGRFVSTRLGGIFVASVLTTAMPYNCRVL